MLVTEFMCKVQRKLKGKDKKWLTDYAGKKGDWFNASDGARFFIAGCGLFNESAYVAINYIFVPYHHISRKDFTERELLEKVSEELTKLNIKLD